jgi:hypothetical protein
MDQTPSQTDPQPPVDPIIEQVGVVDGGVVLDGLQRSTGEIVIYDYDEAGNYLGWHKEIA